MLGTLNKKKHRRRGGVATRNRGGKCVCAWIFGHKKHKGGGGMGATHNKKTNVAHLELWTQKTHSKGAHVQHTSKKIKMCLELWKKKGRVNATCSKK
jgi:hypothetical protein